MRALILDLDGAPLEPVLEAPDQPHLIIESSPGKWHCYWLVAKMPKEEFSEAQIMLAKYFNGDTSVKDLPRVLRLAGFPHQKGEPFLARIVQVNTTPPYSSRINYKNVADKQSDTDDDEFEDAVTELNRRCDTVRNAPEEKRNITLNTEVFQICRRIVLQQLDEDTVRTRFTEAALACELPAREIQKTLKSAIDGGIQKALDKLVIDGDAISPVGSEDALALLFAKKHSGELRYIAAKKQWVSWKGTRWQEDQILHAFDLVRVICREASVKGGNKRSKKNLTTAKTVAAVTSLVRSDKRIVATADQWDKDDWLLNTPGGVVDLRTGEIRKAMPEDYMTKQTAVTPDANCPTPMFKEFMVRITNNNPDLQSYLQRALGYSLTGSIEEQILFFCYGTGNNGKSVLLGTVANILLDHHVVGDMDTFSASNNDKHPAGVAKLVGSRYVTINETEQGRRWNESRIKALTGGEKQTARAMRQDFFDFMPTFKLWFSGNHKPQLRSVDVATKRRFRLIPFDVKIPDDEVDPQFAKKLNVEWPGILHWLVEGCLLWQQQGLKSPKIVLDATNAYFEAEDIFGLWVEDYCVKDPQGWASSTDLFSSWSAFCTANGHYVGSSKALSQKLEDNGYQKHRTSQANGFFGLTLKAPTAATGHADTQPAAGDDVSVELNYEHETLGVEDPNGKSKGKGAYLFQTTRTTRFGYRGNDYQHDREGRRPLGCNDAKKGLGRRSEPNSKPDRVPTTDRCRFEGAFGASAPGPRFLQTFIFRGSWRVVEGEKLSPRIHILLLPWVLNVDYVGKVF